MRSRSIPGPVRRASAGSEGGFTLLEVIVAIVVLGVAVAATNHSVGLGLRAQGAVRGHLEAVALAETRMNELILLPRDSLPGYRVPREGGFAPPHEEFRWQALVRPDSASPRLVRAAVRVEWPGGSYSLETAVYRPDRLPALTGAAP